MPVIPCAKGIFCEGTDDPFLNYSSEAPDALSFLGIGFGPFDPPPLGSIWSELGCFTTCYSYISQEDATRCAQAQAILCVNNCRELAILLDVDPIACGVRPDCFPSDPTCPHDPGHRFDHPPQFYNHAQFCTVHCADGLPFTWTVFPGLYVSGSQILSDRIAYSAACRLAQANKVCFGSIQSQACVGQPYASTVTNIGPNHIPMTFTVSSGSLPPGLGLGVSDGRSQTIVGTPTAGGSYTFTITGTADFGISLTKEYTICAIEITPDVLPTPSLNVPYSALLSATFCATPTLSWQIISGALPDGLFLNEETGEIHGTATKAGSFNFVIELQSQST